jgi:hypothetical protein
MKEYFENINVPRQAWKVEYNLFGNHHDDLRGDQQLRVSGGYSRFLSEKTHGSRRN